MMEILFVLLLFCPVAAPVTHSLKVFFTGLSGDQTWPEFVGVLMIDDVEVMYCDSTIRRAELKQDWMRFLLMSDPMTWYTEECLDGHSSFNTTIKALMQSFSQTGGVHVYQRMFGCEWDDETGEVRGFDQFGYDGEDFMIFDVRTGTWIAPVPQAVMTKQKWENDRAGLNQTKNYLLQLCPERLKKHVNFGRSSLMRTELPSVSLLQKSPSSPVSCHATGFYPDRALMLWRKDGEDLHEDVDQGEILPNHDGSFQMRVDLDLSSVKPEDWGRYECVFQLSGVKEDIIMKLDKAVIRTNSTNSAHFYTALIRGVGSLFLLLVCITGIIIYRRRSRKG
ncbi:major histocompatibility complex class I-related gene protein-like [Trachinotus anak]|uniref:major histocompatibility complex class I-related gene protein-like n=1 Tax=Trachinotus anak TaxID=443729 RepID=UPI0039F2259E